MLTHSVDISVTKNHHHIMKILFSTLAVVILCRVRANTEVREGTKVRALFVGNSYTKGMPIHVQKLAEAQGLTLDVVSVNGGGAQIGKNHAKGKAANLIKKGGYDVVILQEQSQIPAMGEYGMCKYDTIKGAQILVNLIHKFNPNAKVQWFLTWGSQKDGQFGGFEGLL